MAFIGNQPALSYTSFAVQHFTTSATTSYTLNYPVANENEIRLVINNVVQQPGSSYAYTASGTSLTLSAATTVSDTMYAVFLGKAVQTVNPPNGSVGLSQLSATGTKDSTTFLRGDNTFAAVSSDYVLLATVDASSSASVSFDGYFSSTYKNYIVVISGLTPATDNTLLRFRVRQSNADVTSSGYGFAFYGVYRQESTGDGATVAGGNNSYAEINYNQGLSNTAGYGLNGRIYIHNPLATEYRIFQADTSFFMYDENYAKVQTNLIRWSGNNTALSGFTLYMSSGNISSGNFKLYGLK
jgi:hypothetical protein